MAVSGVLVTGASGQVGGALARRLVEAGVPTRALSRDPDPARLPAGVEPVRGDLDDPGSLPEALRGDVERVFLMAPAAKLPQCAPTLCRALDGTNVRHVVLLSSLAVEIPGESPLTTEHGDAERAVLDAGVGWTFVRPGTFASNALMWARSIREEGVVRDFFGDAPATPLDGEDIAAVAFAALTSEEHVGAVLRITGPERLLPSQQTEVLAEVLGRPLSYQALPEEQAVALMAPLYGEHVGAIVAALRDPNPPWGDSLPTVEQVTGRPPATFRAWAARHAAAFA